MHDAPNSPTVEAGAFRGTKGCLTTLDNCGSGVTIGVFHPIKGGEVFIPLGHSAAVRNPILLQGRDPIEREEATANGRLWAAAPELLGALQTMRAILRKLQPAMNVMAREVMDDIIREHIDPAISKALDPTGSAGGAKA